MNRRLLDIRKIIVIRSLSRAIEFKSIRSLSYSFTMVIGIGALEGLILQGSRLKLLIVMPIMVM